METDAKHEAVIGKSSYSTLVASTMPGVERLCGAFLRKDSTTRTDCLSVGAFLHSIVVDSEEPQAILAIAEFVLFLYVISTPRADEKTPALRVINIQPVAAGPALQYLDVITAIVDHLTESALVTYHVSPLRPQLKSLLKSPR